MLLKLNPAVFRAVHGREPLEDLATIETRTGVVGHQTMLADLDLGQAVAVIGLMGDQLRNSCRLICGATQGPAHEKTG